MNPFVRPLTDVTVGISISDSDDGPLRGFPPAQTDQVVRQVVFALLGQGAGVVFGHDWRKDGVMEAVHGFARQVRASESVPPLEGSRPLLENFLPWPDEPVLDENERAQLRHTLHVASAGLPVELQDRAGAVKALDRGDPRYRYLRARGLTHLRQQLNQRTDARICLGGRRSGSAGRYPGVVEEALLAVEARKPLYLAGLMGGATGQVIDAICRRPIPAEFCQPTPAAELYQHPPHPLEVDPATRRDRVFNPEATWATFGEFGVERLAQTNGLNPAENMELFTTPSLDRAIQLFLTGLGRLTLRR